MGCLAGRYNHSTSPCSTGLTPPLVRRDRAVPLSRARRILRCLVLRSTLRLLLPPLPRLLLLRRTLIRCPDGVLAGVAVLGYHVVAAARGPPRSRPPLHHTGTQPRARRQLALARPRQNNKPAHPCPRTQTRTSGPASTAVGWWAVRLCSSETLRWGCLLIIALAWVTPLLAYNVRHASGATGAEKGQPHAQGLTAPNHKAVNQHSSSAARLAGCNLCQ